MTRNDAIRKIAKPIVFAACLGPFAWIAWTAYASGFGPTGPLVVRALDGRRKAGPAARIYPGQPDL